jgi:hypothetical protein
MPERVTSEGAQERMMPGRTGVDFSNFEGETEEDRGSGREEEGAANRRTAWTRKVGRTGRVWSSGDEDEAGALALKTAARLGSNPNGRCGETGEGRGRRLESWKLEKNGEG